MSFVFLLQFARRRSLPALAALLLLLGGCTAYHPHPLPGGPDLAADVGHLHPPAGEAAVLPAKGLNLTQVAGLAVANNPDLKAERARLGIKRAELFEAGLLPDPQLSANLDHPTGNMPDTVNGWGVGLDYDLMALVTRRAGLESARQEERQARLKILWQEWQVSQQARSLAVRLAGQGRRLKLLQKMRDLYQQRYRRSHSALKRGDVTLGVAGTDLTALLDTLSRINALVQNRNDTRHALNLLLGLAPDASVTIRPGPLPEPPNGRQLAAALQTLARRRPDLLALQAGYRSQEARVRGAILAQFPAVNIGINRASDTSGVDTTGFTIGLTLPLFSRNRGAIAVERATRAQLREAYQARLDRAANEADKLIRVQGIVATQMKQLAKYLPTLKQMVDQGRKAYGRGDLDALTFLNMESTWLGKRLEMIDLEQTQRDNFIALQTLLALPDKGTSRTTVKPGGDKP